MPAGFFCFLPGKMRAMPTPSAPRTPLHDLAEHLGVATTYDDYLRRPVAVSDESVRLALTAMGVPAADDDQAREALAGLRAQQRSRRLPEALVVRVGEQSDLAAPADGVPVRLATEAGDEHTLAVAGGRVVIPTDLPLGYHRLTAEDATTHLIVTPGRCPLPLTGPSYGWMAQLYAVRSRASWGMGDYRDLAELARLGGDLGATMVLVNPLHAATPVLPQEPSPYSPTSRRYRNPLYLRIEDIVATPDAQAAREIAVLAERTRNAATDRIDRDAVFGAKTRALELLYDSGAASTDAFERWADAEGDGLVDFATFCVLAEHHGVPWQTWPHQLRHPSSQTVEAFRETNRNRVRFHMWLQWLCDVQLAQAQRTATDSGMAVGVIHDLAVGVDPGGADAWALQDDLATDVTVGAPPDGFNQRGQDWGLPPLLPNRLAATGFAPFRDMLRGVLSHAGGIRIDHVMGLWRLWWVPAGRSAAEGTYVQYPARDLLGVLSLEAHRAGALVVGEDLGTVAEGVREMMAEHRVLSSKVLYFEHVDDDPEQPLLPAADYPDLALVSITTHDLPTAAGWWADEEIRVQTELGLFGASTTPQEQAERKAGERAAMIALLRSEGLIGPDASDEELAVAMHAFIARTPALLVATGLGDALGDPRQPNMPGTIDEYPNWRLPLANAQGPVLLEDLAGDPLFRRIAALLAARSTSGQ